MIDQITVLLPHILMALMVWRLLHRPDLDRDPLAEGEDRRPGARQQQQAGGRLQSGSTPDSRP